MEVTSFFSRAFTEFGPSIFQPPNSLLPQQRIKGRRTARLREQLRVSCPRRQPGVYGMIDQDGILIYVGKAKNLRSRLQCYFRPRGRDPKAGRIIRHSRTIVWENQPSEFAALLRELELIRLWRPRFNVHGQPHRRRRTYICLGRSPAPYLFLSRQPSRTVQVCFGPVPGGHRARAAVRWLNDGFRLRDCTQGQTMIFPEQEELFPVERSAGCLRYEIGTCLGPCTGTCSLATYQSKVHAARAFLAGKNETLLQNLEREMAAASAALEFERAGASRDKLKVLRWLSERLNHVRHARETHSFLYPLTDRAGKTLWYIIHRGGVESVVAKPSDPSNRRTTAAVIERIYQGKQSRFHPGSVEEMDMVFLVAAWFRRHPQERERTLSPETALNLIARESINP